MRKPVQDTRFGLKKVRYITVAICVLAAQGIVKDNLHGHVERYVFRIRFHVDQVALNGRAVV